MRKVVALFLSLGSLAAVKPASMSAFDPDSGSFLFSAGAYSPVFLRGSSHTNARAINNAGQIAGFFRDASGLHGFVHDARLTDTFDAPGAELTFAMSINDSGQIVGYFQDPSTHGVHGFVRSAGSFTTFDVPPPKAERNTYPTGINNSGQIVGYFQDYYLTYAFLYASGSFTVIDTPGLWATGINNAGQIVGTLYDGSRGFLYDGGSLKIIEVPGAHSTHASAINNLGQIVGFFEYRGLTHGFLYDRGSFTVIDVPGALRTVPLGLNDAGQIVGEYSTISTIVPEPRSMLLLGSALLAICAGALLKQQRRICLP